MTLIACTKLISLIFWAYLRNQRVQTLHELLICTYGKEQFTATFSIERAHHFSPLEAPQTFMAKLLPYKDWIPCLNSPKKRATFSSKISLSSFTPMSNARTLNSQGLVVVQLKHFFINKTKIQYYSWTYGDKALRVDTSSWWSVQDQ